MGPYADVLSALTVVMKAGRHMASGAVACTLLLYGGLLYPADVGAASPEACKANQLDAGFIDREGLAGTQMVLRNTSPRACYLKRWPAVEFEGDDGEPLIVERRLAPLPGHVATRGPHPGTGSGRERHISLGNPGYRQGSQLHGAVDGGRGYAGRRLAFFVWATNVRGRRFAHRVNPGRADAAGKGASVMKAVCRECRQIWSGRGPCARVQGRQALFLCQSGDVDRGMTRIRCV